MLKLSQIILQLQTRQEVGKIMLFTFLCLLVILIIGNAIVRKEEKNKND